MPLCPVCATIRLTASSPLPLLRQATTTCQSWVSASARAHSKPKPVLAPVTTAVFMRNDDCIPVKLRGVDGQPRIHRSHAERLASARAKMGNSEFDEN